VAVQYRNRGRARLKFYAGAGSWWFRSSIACAVEAGVAAELGFDQSGDWDGVLGEGLLHCGVEWIPEDVAGESDAATEGDGFGVDEPGEVGELDAESGGGGGEDVAGGDGGPGADLCELGCTAVGVGDAGASDSPA
jgi:hypothetical protein